MKKLVLIAFVIMLLIASDAQAQRRGLFGLRGGGCSGGSCSAGAGGGGGGEAMMMMPAYYPSQSYTCTNGSCTTNGISYPGTNIQMPATSAIPGATDPIEDLATRVANKIINDNAFIDKVADRVAQKMRGVSNARSEAGW
jgi:hypothetical protein